jgi:hypothetical protein
MPVVLRGRKGKLILKGHTRQISNFALEKQQLASVDWLGELILWDLWDPAPKNGYRLIRIGLKGC